MKKTSVELSEFELDLILDSLFDGMCYQKEFLEKLILKPATQGQLEDKKGTTHKSAQVFNYLDAIRFKLYCAQALMKAEAKQEPQI